MVSYIFVQDHFLHVLEDIWYKAVCTSHIASSIVQSTVLSVIALGRVGGRWRNWDGSAILVVQIPDLHGLQPEYVLCIVRSELTSI